VKRIEEEGLRSIAFFGGGTGGHLFPGIALAERARERFPRCRALFFRTARAVEESVFAGRGLETTTLRIRSPGHRPLEWLRYSLDAVSAEREIRAALDTGFDVAFGLGGYASLPGLIAARLLGIPVILLEQNRAPGRVNRWLAPFVDAVACPFRETEFPLAARRAVTGNPVRRDVIAGASLRAGRKSRGERRTVMVVGGSQGASRINQAVKGALAELLEFREKIYWIHVAGDADKDAMTEAYRAHGWTAEVHGYTQELPGLMAKSDLVLSRAGGTTLSELAVMGLPSILVPYPHHKDQHQRKNAEVLVRAGAGRLVEESELGPESLRSVLRDVLFAPERLEAMSRNAQRLARPDAADAILDLALDLQRRCPPGSASSS
jgi:UDP-N-acetylglucosamine--N-acetylmuramyl-(pentapeptide) pyrophosphoryl-undecaprenol N-acetylglucosamine transferase